MSHINKQFIQDVLRPQILEALEALAPLGVTFTLGNCRYGENSGKFELQFGTVNDDGTANTKAMDDFKRYASRYGLSPDDLGRTFVQNGRRFEIVGAKPTNTKYPILANDSTGRTFKFPAWTVKAQLTVN